jgi:Asp/Glu/hydantoin racemase
MTKIVLIHASRAAVDPVTQYYTNASPDLEVTNLLDDGVMRLLRAGDVEAAKNRLADMLSVARKTYAAELALLTCSAVPPEILDELKRNAGFPVLKIDEPMCEAAVQAGSRIGLITSFPPTSATTRALLAEASARARRSIEIVEEQTPDALKALLAGDEAAHDAELLAAADRLAKKHPQVIVLAQVSMARLAPQIAQRLELPVLSSLASSLDAVRFMLTARAAPRD